MVLAEIPRQRRTPPSSPLPLPRHRILFMGMMTVNDKLHNTNDWHTQNAEELSMDQVETTYPGHLSVDDFLPQFSLRTFSARIQEVVSQLTTRKHPLATRSQQACRKPNKYRREARKGFSRKRVQCMHRSAAEPIRFIVCFDLACAAATTKS